MLRKNLPNLFFIVVIFILDRISKYYILELSKSYEKINIKVTSFLNFNLVWNDGIAFGLLSFQQNFYYQIITIIIIMITLVIIWFAFRSKGLEKIGFLMISGGSLGNIFDRLYYSSVIDFIDLSYNNFHWFIFNVADIFITFGVIMLISIELVKTKKA
tara:strand:+ start:951 stop:1424 length:474 start_codon:yes stop_codon:yes gene_type:complete